MQSMHKRNNGVGLEEEEDPSPNGTRFGMKRSEWTLKPAGRPLLTRNLLEENDGARKYFQCIDGRKKTALRRAVVSSKARSILTAKNVLQSNTRFKFLGILKISD
ncbi:hypothetical protein CEXT_447691 [Caerostris extrusa]|uniref:Uncharacterized protein n=1 Tax=Caerostris extrusa TaxID=172846 RepID=A0AAV4US39_CAEEX|nr:hypothetical protein CEXT_447691 [Caerostris extrusa]